MPSLSEFYSASVVEAIIGGLFSMPVTPNDCNIQCCTVTK